MLGTLLTVAVLSSPLPPPSAMDLAVITKTASMVCSGDVQRLIALNEIAQDFFQKSVSDGEFPSADEAGRAFDTRYKGMLSYLTGNPGRTMAFCSKVLTK